jgi:aspartyl/asparaginyl beta-hydroxylase (cupin superfamily)
MQPAVPPPAHRIRESLLAARARHGASALARLEDAFLRATGSRPPLVPSHPLQRPNLFFAGLEERPWLERGDLEAIAMLEGEWTTISDEVLAARAGGFQRFNDGTPHEGDWNALYVRYGAKAVEVNRSLIPRTMEIVNALPRIGVMAMVSALNAGGHIAPHCGVHNLRITAHLGLEIPDGCSFRVADEIRQWREGECLVFDDSFEHEVWNRGQGTRYVLLVDFWHPHLTDIEIEVLDEVEGMMASVRSRLQEGKYNEPVQWWA